MGPGHVGQGLCWGQGKPLGAPAEGGAEGLLLRAFSSCSSQLSLHDGHQKHRGTDPPRPETSTLHWRACRTHRSDFNFSAHDGFVPPQARLLTGWLSTALGASQRLVLTFPSVPFQASGRACEVCSGAGSVLRCCPLPPTLPEGGGPGSAGEGGRLGHRAGHALDGPLQDAVEGVLHDRARAESGAWARTSGHRRAFPGLQGHLRHKHRGGKVLSNPALLYRDAETGGTPHPTLLLRASCKPRHSHHGCSVNWWPLPGCLGRTSSFPHSAQLCTGPDAPVGLEAPWECLIFQQNGGDLLHRGW